MVSSITKFLAASSILIVSFGVAAQKNAEPLLSARARSKADFYRLSPVVNDDNDDDNGGDGATCDRLTKRFSTISKKKDHQIDSLQKELNELKKKTYRYGPDEVDFGFHDHRALKEFKKDVKFSFKKDVKFSKKSKKNLPTIAPTIPIPPNAIEVKCFPEDNMRTFDFNAGPGTPMALFPGGGGVDSSDTGYLNWSFNRGLSAITVGSFDSTDPNSVPATVYAILGSGQGGPDGNTAGFSVTAARYNEQTTSQSLGLKYNTDANTAQNQQLGEVTTVTIIVPYSFNPTTQSYQPDTESLRVIPFLVGVTNGNVYLCTIEPSGLTGLDATCDSNPIEAIGSAGNGITGNISEILYIPQINAVVIMTFEGVLLSYSVSFDDGIPTLGPNPSQFTDYQNSNPSSQYGGGGITNSVVLPRSLAAVYVNQTTTYLYAAGLWGTSGDYYAPLTVFSIDGTDASLPINYVGNLSNTFWTYQVVPVPTGIFFLAGGAGVFYVPYLGQDAPNGMLGIEPTIYQAFGVPSSGPDMDEFLPVTVSSIAFSGNPNNVVVYRDVFTGEDKYAFEGGALFISFISQCGLTEGRTIDGCQQSYASNGCIGSIAMVDACTGVLSEFVVDNVQGPVYTSIADVNMNLLVQNGQGGLSTYSVPYTPGLVQNVEWLKNEYYENSCDCTPAKSLLVEILAGVALVLAIVAIPELLPDAAAFVVAYAGIATATVGIAATFAPIANGDRRLI